MSRVLVTGGTGLLGRAVVPALAAFGYDVVATTRGDAATPSQVRVDLTEWRQVRDVLDRVRPARVLHLAGGPRPAPAQLYRDNVVATGVLLSAAGDLGLRFERFVAVGSAAEYGDAGARPIGETQPLRPAGGYGLAKAAQAHVTGLLAPELTSPGGLVLARPFNVVAPALPPSTPLGGLRAQLLAEGPGEEVVVRHGRLDLARDFLSVSAAVDALIGLVRHEAPPPVVNVCSGRPTRLGELFHAAAACSGRRVRFEEDPALMALPAVPHVVGDPSALRRLGLHRAETPEQLAEALLAAPRD